MTYFTRQKLRHLSFLLSKTLAWVSIGLILFVFTFWCTIALYFSNLPWATLRLITAIIFAVGVPASFVFFKKRLRTLCIVAGVEILIIIWWCLIPASHDRIWETSVAVLPYAEINGNLITVHNIRDFDYQTEKDFTVKYYDKTYDLNKLETLDFIVSHWDNNVAVAHTLLSFGFSNGDYLCVSVETRREKGEPQTAIRGLFKQYELIYILADERDILRLRTNFRKEHVYLYPTTSNKEEVRIVFLDIIKRVNEIAEEPEFYNTLLQNCTTALAPSVEKIRPPKPFDLRLLANGFSDEMALQNGWIKSKLPYEAAKRKFFVNPHVLDDNDPKDYSRKIRPWRYPASQ